MADPQIRTILRQLERLGERSVRRISLDITSNLIESTPVDTGWARANWIPSVTTPEEGTDGTRAAAEAGNVSTGKQTAGQVKLGLYQLAQGQVFVANNVPYILRLNDGSSSKAPAGFVEAAIKKAVTQDLLGIAS